MFVLQFIVYCILFIVSIQLFAATPNKPQLIRLKGNQYIITLLIIWYDYESKIGTLEFFAGF